MDTTIPPSPSTKPIRTYRTQPPRALQDVMEEHGLGPNGALVYCMEYLEQNVDWLLGRLEGNQAGARLCRAWAWCGMPWDL